MLKSQDIYVINGLTLRTIKIHINSTVIIGLLLQKLPTYNNYVRIFNSHPLTTNIMFIHLNAFTRTKSLLLIMFKVPKFVHLITLQYRIQRCPYRRMCTEEDLRDHKLACAYDENYHICRLRRHLHPSTQHIHA